MNELNGSIHKLTFFLENSEFILAPKEVHQEGNAVCNARSTTRGRLRFFFYWFFLWEKNVEGKSILSQWAQFVVLFGFGWRSNEKRGPRTVFKQDTTVLHQQARYIICLYESCKPLTFLINFEMVESLKKARSSFF